MAPGARSYRYFSTFHVVTLIGHGKQEAPANFARTKAFDILAIQETKATSSDERRVLGGKLFLLPRLSTWRASVFTGVGFHFPACRLPLVADFLPHRVTFPFPAFH